MCHSNAQRFMQTNSYKVHRTKYTDSYKVHKIKCTPYKVFETKCIFSFKVHKIPRFFRDMEESSMSSSHHLFHGTGRSPLYRVVLHRSDICLQGLQAPPTEPI